jgi:ABC-type multidrug transport system fused ATPase/permease subunit
MSTAQPLDRGEPGAQDAALFWLIASTAARHWRFLLGAVLLLAVAATLNVVPPYLLQQAIDGPIARRDAPGLWPLALTYAGVALAVFFLTIAQVYLLQQAGQRALADLRVRLLNHMLRQGQGFFAKHPVGDLVGRVTGDIDSLNALLSSSVVTILTESVTLVAIVGVMFATNWRLALLALSVLPVLLVVTRFFRRRIRRSSSGERTALAKTTSFFNEQIQGMLIVQLFGRQAESEREFDGYNRTYREALIRRRSSSRCWRCCRRWAWLPCSTAAARACWRAGPRSARWWPSCSTRSGPSSPSCGSPSSTTRCRSALGRPSGCSAPCSTSPRWRSTRSRCGCRGCAAGLNSAR